MTAAVSFSALWLVLAQQGDKKGEMQPPRPAHIKVPPAPALSPAEELRTFKIAPGFRIELAASEPMVEDPVAIAFDGDGRMWVVEMRGYMPNLAGQGEAEPVGRIVVLEDTDGDGVMDRRAVFADGLVLPRAVCPVLDGALVAAPPNLLFIGKEGRRDVVASDYASQGNPEHMPNGLLWAMDNWIYSAVGGVRFRWSQGRWERSSTVSKGQWGITQDDDGRLFYNTNSDHLRGDAVPIYSPHAHLRGPGVNLQISKDNSTWPIRPTTGVNRGYRSGQLREDGTLATFTAACAPCVYRGDQFPDEFRANIFSCEPAGNFVRRDVLTSERTARNPYDRSEFLASTDERFRPVNLSNGPDGALYVVDMYRGVIQHRAYVTTYLRGEILERGLEAPIHRGRIFRVVHERKISAREPTTLSKDSSIQLVKQLSHPNGWRRDTAQRILVERNDASVVGALRQAALSSVAKSWTRIHALMTLDGMGKIDPPVLVAASADADPKMQAAVAALTEAHDPLGLLNLLQSASINPELSPQALSRLAGHEIEFLELLLGEEEWEKPAPGRDRLLTRLSGRVFEEGRPESVAELIDIVGGQPAAAAWRRPPMLEMLPKKNILLAERPPGLAKMLASAEPALRHRAAELTSKLDWPGKESAEPAAADPLPSSVPPERFARGHRFYKSSCAICHLTSGFGQEGRAPALVDSPWVLGSEARLIRIVTGGLRGPIAVRGKKFDMDMPPHFALGDQDVADVLTYIRREWGHQATPVDDAAVSRVRNATEDREDPWTVAELLKIP